MICLLNQPAHWLKQYYQSDPNLPQTPFDKQDQLYVIPKIKIESIRNNFHHKWQILYPNQQKDLIILIVISYERYFV